MVIPSDVSKIHDYLTATKYQKVRNMGIILEMYCILASYDQWPFLVTWFNFNPNMDK